MVVDFDTPDNSVYISATGQSGHLLSRYYDDLSVIWRRSEYIPDDHGPRKCAWRSRGRYTLAAR